MSPHHFTKSTVEASVWCNRCNKMTPWRIADGHRQFCKTCYDKPPLEKVAKPEAAPQMEMFK